MDTYEIDVYKLHHPSDRFDPGEWDYKATFNVPAGSLEQAMDLAEVILEKAGFNGSEYTWTIGKQLSQGELNELPF